MENCLGGKGILKLPKPRGRGKRCNQLTDHVPIPRDPVEITKSVIDECKNMRKRMANDNEVDISDERLSKMARFTDKFSLKPYEPFLHYVPRVVNVVT
tara:strand:- start:1415 stop:1708 length:294 start_codon:yes stop_codon:yes gene_type:complete